MAGKSFTSIGLGGFMSTPHVGKLAFIIHQSRDMRIEWACKVVLIAAKCYPSLQQHVEAY